MKYTYKDFETGKIHWTKARFIGWTEPTGLLSVPYAVFLRPSGEELCIPEYLLTVKTRLILK